ncbi:MAG TPA: S8 family serine peptidase [Methanospirillum sp.]|jgi:subtilisin family serine protease|uniref:S8 family serine peptidase n=2 Tax=Methanospirillum sp. TaxID=45200 RepID=UPI001BD1C46C|nr:S8 family serine peptidase [Methanospirillum sp.]HPY59719.1 S8 family serine peptidase [Methanospirillum sp.]
MHDAHLRLLIHLLLAGFLLSGFAVGAYADESTALDDLKSQSSAPYVPGEVIVKYKDGTVAALAAEGTGPVALKALGAEVATDFSAEGLDNLQALDITGPISVKEAIAELENSPYVAYAEPNYIISLSLPETDPAGSDEAGDFSALTFPNDPKFADQWGLSNTGQTGGVSGADIKALKGWEIAKGSDTIVVAVLDTGVDYTHPDLAGNIWVNPGEIPNNGIDDDGNGYVDDVYGYDFINNDNDPMDDNGHGTHCAGIIGAIGNNGIGVAGVTWKVKIMPLKFLRADGTGDTAASLNAIAYARRMGADIISCSWGGKAKSQALGDAIASTNALFPCAAGNEGSDNDKTPHYPSGFDLPQIISVAASDAKDGIPAFSNYGATKVDVAAPGDWIMSTYPTSLGHQYVKMKGTSMATPYVSGLAALLLAKEPSLTPAKLKARIMDTVDKLPAFAGKTVSGGRINVYKALGGGGSTPGVIPIPGMSKPPRDLNGDGRYEDLNGNGRADYSDVVTFFKYMDWISKNEPVEAFDFSGNGRIDFTDVVKLFQSI